jgi:hypothetical protein
MTLPVFILTVAIIYAIWELIIWWLVRYFKPKFHWIVTPDDIAPEISQELVERHLQHGFDPELGWVRVPNTTGFEQTEAGSKPFVIDDWGCRENPGFKDAHSKISTFGDSFAFCRLAGSDETWPFFLSCLTESNVRNFGVGNYGLDQAILRFEREVSKLDSKFVLLIIVPETMARIHSYWKHYYEYGNILAFKPRFMVAGNELIFHPVAVAEAADYANYRRNLNRIQKTDHFFERKFLKDLLAFPFVPKVLRRARRYIPIFWHLILGVITGNSEGRQRKAFDVVSRRNAEYATDMYSDPDACALFAGLIRRFNNSCATAGIEGLLVILPQPVDLELPSHLQRARGEFFESLEKVMTVLDLTVWFGEMSDWRRYFFDGERGPHLNSEGNRLVADYLFAELGTRFPEIMGDTDSSAEVVTEHYKQ